MHKQGVMLRTRGSSWSSRQRPCTLVVRPASVCVVTQPDREGQLGKADRRGVGLVGWALALVGESVLERKAPSQHASRYGPIVRADPGQEHSEAAVVESREPQPCPTATCYGHVSRPGSPLRS